MPGQATMIYIIVILLILTLSSSFIDLVFSSLIINTTSNNNNINCQNDGKFHYIYDKRLFQTKFTLSINEIAKNPDTNSYEFGDMYATENVLIDEFINSPCKTNNIHNATYFLIPIPFTRISQGWDPYNHNVYSDFFGLNLLVDQIAKFLSQQYPIQWKTGNNIFISIFRYYICNKIAFNIS